MGLLSGLLKAVPGIGTAAGLLEAGMGIAGGISQMGKANQINPNWKPYQVSPYAQKKLGLAQQMANGRMAGAANLENNIAANQAGTISNINNNATDSATALQLATGAQGQSNDAYSNLAVKEGQNKLSLMDNLNQAYDTMTQEEKYKYENELAKYGMDVDAQSRLRQAGATNLANGINRLGSTAMQAGQLFGNGGRGRGMTGGFTVGSSIGRYS